MTSPVLVRPSMRACTKSVARPWSASARVNKANSDRRRENFMGRMRGLRRPRLLIRAHGPKSPVAQKSIGQAERADGLMLFRKRFVVGIAMRRHVLETECI